MKVYNKFRELSTQYFTANNLRLQQQQINVSPTIQAICRYYRPEELQSVITDIEQDIEIDDSVMNNVAIQARKEECLQEEIMIFFNHSL